MRRGSTSKLPIGIGVGLVGVAGSLPPILEAAQRYFPQLAHSYAWLPSVFTDAEIILGVAGLVSFACYPFFLFDMGDHIQLAKMRIGAWMLGAIDATIAYEVAFARAADLPDLRRFCLKTIGPGISALKKMKRWNEHNPRIFRILVPSGSDEDTKVDTPRAIHGYYGVIPLRESARRQLDEEQLDGASFTTDHICTVGENPSAYYLAGVAAEHKIARIKILRELKRYIEGLVANGPLVFYTRPVTEDGLKLVDKLGFTRVDGSPEVAMQEIHKKTIGTDDLRKAAA